jgi:predicted dehydrogenase
VYNVKIFGAGSIGNHLAHAARSRGWAVTLTDLDEAALDRSKTKIYPERYGAWDDEIALKLSRDAMTDPADVVIIGTPPDSHIAIADAVMDETPPKILLIEKPVAGPGLEGCEALWQKLSASDTIATVGYNHLVSQGARQAERIIAEGRLGEVQSISARTREHWGGIFNAHPWLAGPEESYLGYSHRGGGAICEHSHALNIWQHFATMSGAGRVAEVSATIDMVTQRPIEYDRLGIVTLTSEHGLIGDVIQDVITQPTEKSVRLQGSDGYLEWRVNHRPDADAIFAGSHGEMADPVLLAKTRADDFIAEIEHLEGILEGSIVNSPLSLERGLDTMMVIAAAFKSHDTGRRVLIDWKAGYKLEALRQ